MPSGGHNKGKSKYDKEALALVSALSGKELSLAECAKVVGYSTKQVYKLITYITFLFPVYETGSGKKLKYGILKRLKTADKKL